MLIYCQRRNKVPVALRGLEVRPPSLKPPVWQISISDTQQESGPLPSVEDVTRLPWILVDERKSEPESDEVFRLGDRASVIKISCNLLTAKDIRGQRQAPLCDTRMTIGSGVVRIHFQRPGEAEGVRRLVVAAADYLSSMELEAAGKPR